jgi:hypothetical protein
MVHHCGINPFTPGGRKLDKKKFTFYDEQRLLFIESNGAMQNTEASGASADRRIHSLNEMSRVQANPDEVETEMRSLQGEVGRIHAETQESINAAEADHNLLKTRIDETVVDITSLAAELARVQEVQEFGDWLVEDALSLPDVPSDEDRDDD